MKYLVDTNIWLERLLEQEKSEIVFQFLELVPPDDILVSDFSIHSIGVILSRHKKLDLFTSFLKDVFENGQIHQLSLRPVDLIQVVSNMLEFNLDFDDSYQLTVSRKFDLPIVTFDGDFNVVGIRKYSPEEIILQQRPIDLDSLLESL